MTPPPKKQRSFNLLNISINDYSCETLLSELKEGVVFTPNIHHFVMLQKDYAFYQAYQKADFVLLDSQVIYLMLKLLGRPAPHKLSGSDFFPVFCEHHKDNEGVHIFLLGGQGDVASRAMTILNRAVGRTIATGALSPSINFFEDSSEIASSIDLINRSGATVLALGFSGPKQEYWIMDNKNKLKNVKIYFGVGATFNFITGTEKRAPIFMRKAGLEWFYRILQNPLPMMRRYLLEDVDFFRYFYQYITGKYKNPFS